MKIVIGTPLYPPDIAQPAPYVKELGNRLAQAGHSIVIVAYAHLPEKIPGVKIIAINKNQPLFVRLSAYTKKLWNEVKKADVVYIQNGASVELPAFLISFFSKKPLFIGISDPNTHMKVKQNFFLAFIENMAKRKVRGLITDIPPNRPEILLFKDTPIAEQTAYESSWKNHIKKLIETFGYAT